MERCFYCGSGEAPRLADPPNDRVGAFQCPNCGVVWVQRVVPREYVEGRAERSRR